MATAVLRMETRNFATMKRKGEEVLGIDKGGLWALSKHNERKEVNYAYEVKSKQSRKDAIDETRTKENIYYKRLSPAAVNDLQEKEHRKNTAGAFEMVFDFQDLREETLKNFKQNQEKKLKTLVEKFLEEQGISERFETLEMVLHLDEKNPHFHILFSGWDKIEQKWGYNDFFNPVEEKVAKRDKDGKKIPKKHNRGKLKGQVMEIDGEIQYKTEDKRKNGAQFMQDTWGEFLETYTKGKMRNKKVFASMLQFNNYVWSRFSDEEKELVYSTRKIETEYYSEEEQGRRIKLKKQLLENTSKMVNRGLEIQDKRNKNEKARQSNLKGTI